MDKSVVISGEASETDSEEESSNVLKKAPDIIRAIQGSVVTGEDSESEDDNIGSVSSAASALTQTQVDSPTSHVPSSYNTLLHRKLRESNSQLHTDVEDFCNDVVNDACRTMSATDQNLLRSQITFQSALSAIKSLNTNSATVKNKLQSLLSAKFIPKINVPVSSQRP